jgi:hypothetical protein
LCLADKEAGMPRPDFRERLTGFRKQFAGEEDCWRYLVLSRWPEGLAGGVEPGKACSVERPWRAVDTARDICYYSCFRLEHGRCAFVVPFAGTRRYAVSPNRSNGHQRRRCRP